MNVAVIASPDFENFPLVESVITRLPLGVTVRTTGANEAETVAYQTAYARGQETEILARNKDSLEQLLDSSDLLIAFLAYLDNCEVAIVERAHEKCKTVKLVRSTFPLPSERDDDLIVELPTAPEPRVEGQGPFSIMGGLGDFALRRRYYLTDERWAQIMSLKRQNPKRLAFEIAPEFIEFFQATERLGVIHAITTPPRSKRFLDMPHVMDLACACIAPEIGTQFVSIFEPWKKAVAGSETLGRTVRVRPWVSQFVGKVVWVLDDITHSNATLRLSVDALTSLGVHAHGLAYVVV